MNINHITAIVRNATPPCFGLRVAQTDQAIVAFVGNDRLCFAGEKLCDDLGGALMIDADETQATILLDDDRELRLLANP